MSDQPARSSAAPAAGRLLVVDDNDDNRNVLSRRLRSKGYAVDIAEDGPSCLAACDKETYDAILLDVMMPGMSGIEVLDHLRKKWAKTELSVIMATAKNDSTSVVDALKRGANDYVTKPIDFPVLLARLESQLAVKAEAAAAAARAATHIDVTFGIAPGTVLCDRYEVLDKRGEGGFAVVYRARQLSTNRDVAIKHLRPDVLGASSETVQLERFERESKLIGDLNHPHVVRLIDTGRLSVRPGAPVSAIADDDQSVEKTRNDLPSASSSASASQTRRRPPEQDTLEVPYIVMELLTGEPMADLIEREAPLDATKAVDLILPVLSALSAAHEKGVVHRDVKPSNIMLTTNDRGEIEPKVLDFGIAKLTTREGSDLTVSASLVGTPQYMSPEQALGRKNLDGRADQFSSAAVLYQALTGRSLYQGESLLELVSKVLAGVFTPMDELRPGLPKGLVAAVTRALSSEPDSRYPSMMAFGRALMPFASEKAARRWQDHFEHHSIDIDRTRILREAEQAREASEKSVGSDGHQKASAVSVVPERPGGSDPTLQVVGVEKARSEPPPAPSPTLASETPIGTPVPSPAAPTTQPSSIAPAPSKMPWERVVLIFLATAIVFYLLARYF